MGSFASHFAEIEESPLLSAGNALMQAGRYMEAAHSYRNAAELETKDAHAWRGLAGALYHGNRPLDADVAFQALVSLSPDNADDLSSMARNLTRILGRLALSVVEVSRDGDHSLVDLVAEIRFGSLFQLAQRLSRDFLRGES